jgi:ornithine cyclodeaminase/alanine dehydrogenase-like protein (mu-crystallin family)
LEQYLLKKTIQFVSDAEVIQHLNMPRLIDAMAHTLMDVSAGRVIQPPRAVHEVPHANADTGLLFVKPVITAHAIVTKLITQMPANSTRGLPTMMATLIVMNRETGAVEGVMDATALTNLRTAAVSAVAVRALVADQPIVVALIGSGALARTHAQAIRAVRSVRELRVWSPNAANARACARDVQGIAMESAEAAVRDADVIVTVTLASAPVVRGAWLKQGALVCAVGAPRPTWRELDDAAMHAGIVIGDSFHSARNEAGDVLLSGAKVVAEMGEVLSGAYVVPANTTVIFKALGLAAEDAAAARLVLEAMKEGK